MRFAVAPFDEERGRRSPLERIEGSDHMTLAKALMRRFRRTALRGKLIGRVGADEASIGGRSSRFDDLSERRTPRWPEYLSQEETSS